MDNHLDVATTNTKEHGLAGGVFSLSITVAQEVTELTCLFVLVFLLSLAL
jgi:hypothetical protein